MNVIFGSLAGGFNETTNGGSRSISESFTCYWDPFPPTDLPQSALTIVSVPSLSALCYVVLS